MPRSRTLERERAKIATVFATNPKQDVVNATYGASQKVWQNKADFDSKIPAVVKAIADAKGKIKDVASLKVAYDAISTKLQRLPRDLSRQAEVTI